MLLRLDLTGFHNETSVSQAQKPVRHPRKNDLLNGLHVQEQVT